MPNQERVFELLERWEEFYRQGKEISPAELCAAAPELLPEVTQALEKLRHANNLLDLETPEPTALSPAEPGSASRSSPWPWVSKGSSRRPSPTASPMALPGTTARDEEVPVTWKPGDVILGLYEVREVFTGGGRGLVYRIWHRGWGIDLAVKSPRPEYFRTERDKADFEEEAETWVNLPPHPHTVTCFYVRRLGGVPRVFAEYVAGGSLAHWIQLRHLYRGGPERALERVLDVAIQMAWGLQQAHEHGLVHRDVKPGNILLTAEGLAKVTDFGMARARGVSLGDGGPTSPVSSELSTSILVSAGGMTPAFCSPEQAEGQPVSRKTDIWSWGVSVLAMFTGAVTWSAGCMAPGVLQHYLHAQAPADPALPTMPSAVAELLRHCFQGQPEARPRDMREIIALLQDVYVQTTRTAYPRKSPRPTKALADSLNNRAVSLCDLHKLEEAQVLWQEALTAGPQHPEATYNLGLCRWRTGRLQAEVLVQNLRDLCTTHPGEWLPRYLLAQVYLEQGKATEARAALQGIPGREAALPEVRAALVEAEQRSTAAEHCLQHFVGHSDWVSSVCMSPAGRFGLSGSADRTLKSWDLSTGQCLQTFHGHADWVTAVCLSEDGQQALSGSADRTLKRWDVATGQCVQTLQGHGNWVLAVALRADQRYAVSAGGDGELKLWELATGNWLRDFTGHDGPVLCLAWSADGRWLLSGGRDKTLKLWDIASGQCVRSFMGHSDKIHTVTLSRDLRWAASGSADRTIKLWDVETGRCLRTLHGHTDGVLSLASSADGRFLLSGSGDQTMKQWRVRDGCCLATLTGHRGAVCAVALAEDGQLALSGSGDQSLRLWRLPSEWVAPYLVARVSPSETVLAAWMDFERALTRARQALGRGEAVRAAQWVRQARNLPGHGGRPEALELWSRLYRHLPRTTLQGGWEGKTLAGHLDAVTTVCLSPDSNLALSGSADRTLKLWDVATGRCVRTFVGHAAEITAACFVPALAAQLRQRRDGRKSAAAPVYLLSASADRTLKFWDGASGRCLSTFQGHTDVVTSVAVTADGRFALSGSIDRTLRLWDMFTGLGVRVLAGHADPIHSVSVSPEGRYALSGAAQFLIRPRRALAVPTGNASAFSEEDERLFTSGQLKLWELATGRWLPTFADHADAVTAVHLGFQGRYALSGGGYAVPQYQTGHFVQSGPIHLWEVATGRCVGRFAGHAGAVTAVALSLDGHSALSGGTDRTLKLWETSSGQCVRTFTGHVDAVTAVALSAEGRYALSGSADRTLKLWILDWELADQSPSDWDEGARPYVEAFLRLHTPYQAEPTPERKRTMKEIVNLPLSRLFKPVPAEAALPQSLRRGGKPRCTERDFRELLELLGGAGFGWLRPEGVRARLKQLLREGLPE